MSIISLIFSALMGLLAIPIINDDPSALAWMSSLAIGVPTVTALCCGLIGVLGIGHEFRYGTIRPTLTALPRRVPVMLAKIAVPGVFSFLLSVACLAVNYAIAWIFVRGKLQTPAFSADVLRVMLGAALFAVGFCVFGVGLTALFRNQVAGIVMLIVLPLIVENAIAAALYLIPWFNSIEDWARFLPFTTGRAMYTPPRELVANFETIPLGPLPGGAVYFAFGAAVCLLGIWRFVRSDA
jgi:ABC-2 type transport system permease protein